MWTLESQGLAADGADEAALLDTGPHGSLLGAEEVAAGENGLVLLNDDCWDCGCADDHGSFEGAPKPPDAPHASAPALAPPAKSSKLYVKEGTDDNMYNKLHITESGEGWG